MTEYYGTRRSGISWLPVIVFALLFSVLAVTSFYYYHRSQVLRQDLEALRGRTADPGRGVVAVEGKNRQLQRTIQGQEDTLRDFRALASDRSVGSLDAYAEGIQIPTFPNLPYPDAPEDQPESDDAPARLSLQQAIETLDTVRELPERDIPIYLANARDRLLYLIQQSRVWSSYLAHLRHEQERLAGMVQRATSELGETRRNYDATVANLERQLANAKDRTASIRRYYGDEQRSLVSERQEIANRINAERDRQSIAEADYLRNRLELERNIRDYERVFKRPQYYVHTPSGRLVSLDLAQRRVTIDAGSRHGVVRGMRFLIFRPGEYTSRIQELGHIEVTRVDTQTSEATLTSFDSSNPPVVGDAVENPILRGNRSRPVRFVVAGPFSLLPYSAPEAIDIIGRWGADVVDEIDHTIDFLVADDTAVDQIEEARVLNVPIIPPSTFIKFIGR